MFAILAIFVYPLAMPLLSLAAVVFVAFARGPIVSRIIFASVVSVILALALGPALTTTASGTFAHPWWYSLNAKSSAYAFPYGCLVFVASVVLSFVVAAVRGGWEKAASARRHRID